jgi:hypothetical protein
VEEEPSRRLSTNESRASFRFYAELNDHLRPGQQFQTMKKEFFVPVSVKDMIESFSVPHAEVELVLVNGESSDFSRLVRNGDRVAVYPVFESLDVTPALRLRPQALRESKFALDVHLGMLAGLSAHAWVRCCVWQSRHRPGTGADLLRTKAHPPYAGLRSAQTCRRDSWVLAARDGQPPSGG